MLVKENLDFISYHVIGTDYTLRYNKSENLIEVFSEATKKVEKTTKVKLNRKEFQNECRYYFEQTIFLTRGLN